MLTEGRAVEFLIGIDHLPDGRRRVRDGSGGFAMSMHPNYAVAGMSNGAQRAAKNENGCQQDRQNSPSYR